MPDGLIPKGSAIGSFGKRNGPGLTQRLWVTFRLGTSSAACRPAHSILTKPWCTEGVVEVRGEALSMRVADRAQNEFADASYPRPDEKPAAAGTPLRPAGTTRNPRRCPRRV